MAATGFNTEDQEDQLISYKEAEYHGKKKLKDKTIGIIDTESIITTTTAAYSDSDSMRFDEEDKHPDLFVNSNSSLCQCYITNSFKLGAPVDEEILRILNSRQQNKLVLTNKRLKHKQWLALFLSLANGDGDKRCFTEFNFSNSNLRVKAYKVFISILRRENSSVSRITKLILSGIDLHGDRGIVDLGKALSEHGHVQRLVLVNCQLEDSDLEAMQKYLMNNNRLLKLKLSSNRIGKDGGDILGKVLRRNRCIEKLDLSWNQIRTSGSRILMQGLMENTALLYFDISFNGLGDEGAARVGVMLEKNKTLITLNLRDNRITNEGAKCIAYGLAENKTLNSLILSGNLMTSAGMSFILAAVIKSKSIELKELHMKLISPDTLCMRAIKYLQKSKIMVTYGEPFLSKAKPHRVDPSFVVREEIFEEIRAYLARERLRMLDLFNMWDRSKLGGIDVVDLAAGLTDCGIPVTEAILEEVFRKVDKDNNGLINYAEFVAITKLN